MMDLVHDSTMDLVIEIPHNEVASTKAWKADDREDLYYLPALATQHGLPLPLDFKRQR